MRQPGTMLGARVGTTLATLALGASVHAAAWAAPLESTRALAAALARSGRAEAALEMPRPGMPLDPSGTAAGAPRATTRATLSIETPDRARIDIAGTGERITLRPDGGEWLQPHLRQMVKLSPPHAALALRWWRLLSIGAGAHERRLGDRHYRLRIDAAGDADADSAEVWLDPRGLPARLSFAGVAGLPGEYRIFAWRFPRARGAEAFRLSAPTGYETVELP